MGKIFRLLGLKVLSPSDVDQATIRNVQCMQKSLFGREGWLYFYEGVNITDERIMFSKKFIEDQMLYNTNRVALSFCALVGKNGSGKSSIIDMIIRILNNLSAAIIGEEKEFNAAERLHFIPAVYGEIAVLIDKRVIIIKSYGQSLKLFYYEYKSTFFTYTETKELQYLKEQTNDSMVVKKNKPSDYTILTDLFYTIICNYSMYAYNYQDYIREADDRSKASDKNNCQISEDDIWLQGVFHKNDGYQTPVVIHPMRSHGMMDIPKENMLAKERLLSMLFYKDADERFSFRYINEELVIIAVHLPPLENKKFTKGMIRETLKIKKGSMLYDNFDKYYKMILDSWMTWIGLPMPEGNETIEHQYVVYKTIKIIRTYKQYYKVSGNLFSKNCNLELFKSHMEMMHSDTSHVTLKLRRCLFKLKFNLYRNGERDIYKLDDAFKDANKVCNEKKNEKWNIRLIDLLPPPTTNIIFQIVKTKGGRTKQTYSPMEVIPFEGLSSGERQIAYTVSNLMYHIINIDSVSSKYLMSN